LKQSGTYEQSLIVLLSDHGESLGEHGESEHGFFVYNATIHVPLIVKPPARSRMRRNDVEHPVETIAVAPTLLHLAGLHDKIENQFQATDLFAPGGEQDRPAYSETFYPFSSFGWSPLHSLETSRYHYIDAPRPELYDVRGDAEEKSNVAASSPEVASVLKDELKQLLAKTRSDSPLRSASTVSPDAADKLRALGYVAYRSPVSDEALAKGLADPKDKIGELNSILGAQDAFRAGQFDHGKELLNKVTREDPQMYVVPFLLGEAASHQQDWNAAVGQFSRCLELNANFDEAMTGLARALHEVGKDADARAWLGKAVTANPQNYKAWYELGVLQARVNPAAALQAYDKAVSIQPNFAAGQRELGILSIRHRQYKEGSQHLNRAIQLGLDDAHARNFLGIAYTQTGRLTLALKALQEAIRQDPTLAEAHLNLGFAYQKLHRSTAAKSEYDTACRLQSRFCGVMSIQTESSR
jgi:Tfp pilus assembly protein PilF